jgi:hypothetical protein
MQNNIAICHLFCTFASKFHIFEYEHR